MQVAVLVNSSESVLSHLFRTVVNKVDGISNEYRNFELDLLAGEDNYVTEVIEGGVRYKLDFSKVRHRHQHNSFGLKLFMISLCNKPPII